MNAWSTNLRVPSVFPTLTRASEEGEFVTASRREKLLIGVRAAADCEIRCISRAPLGEPARRRASGGRPVGLLLRGSRLADELNRPRRRSEVATGGLHHAHEGEQHLLAKALKLAEVPR